MEKYNAVKEPDGTTNFNLREELKAPKALVAYRYNFVEMLAQYENMWDGHLESMKTVQHRIELEKSKNRPIHLARYRYRPKATEPDKRQIERMVAMDVIEPAQTEPGSLIVMGQQTDGTIRFCVGYGN